MEVEEPEINEAEDDEKKPLPVASLSKSWAIQSAHVPIFTGGKVVHSRSPPSSKQATPGFLLLPVGGDVALVDAKRGVKWGSLRGEDTTTTLEDVDDEDEGLDADAITCYALTWSNDVVITCSYNQLIRQYSLKSSNDQVSATLVKTWSRSGHILPVTHMEFHVSNVFLATGSVDGTVRVWDVRGTFVTHVFRPLAGGDGGGSGRLSVTALEWHRDAQKLILAIGRDDGSIAIHDLRRQKTGGSKEDHSVISVLRDHMSAVTSMSWSDHLPDIFVSTGRDAVLSVWRIIGEKADGDRATRGRQKKGEVTSSVYRRIQTVPVYEQVEGMVLLPPRFGTGAKKKNSDLVVATAGSKGIVRIWTALHNRDGSMSGLQVTAEQKVSAAFGEARGGYTGLLYNPHAIARNAKSKELLVVVDAEHNLSFLDLSDRKDQILAVDRTIVGHNDDILDLKILPPSCEEGSGESESKNTASRIVVATNSPQVRLFELENFSCDVLDGHTATVLCVSVSPCGRYIATSGKDKTMRLWHTRSKKCVAVATGHTEAVGATSLSRKQGRYDVHGKAAKNGAGAFAVTASKDRTLKRWNLPGAAVLDECAENAEEGDLVAFASVRAHEKDINITTVAPNDSLVATGSQDKTVKLWKSSDLSLQGTLVGHRRGVWDCQFSPYDRVVATSSGDRTVKLWSLSDYSCVRTFQGHVASALRVRFLSSGLQLVSAGADGLIKLWTIRTNECEATMDGHTDKVWALDLSPNGKELISGGADSQLVVWKDNTRDVEDAKRAEEEQSILLDQELSNLLRRKDYSKALNIALQLDKPMQTLKIITSIIEDDSPTGPSSLELLQQLSREWPMDRVSQILRYCREWNTRARNSHVAMLLLKAIVTTIPVRKLAATEGIPEILAGITPYAERHYDRLDRLQTSSYLLDFTLFSMGSLDAPDDEFMAWEAQSKLVLPPKLMDGRIQIGGRTIVGRATDGDDSDDEVVTIGDSESSEGEQSDTDSASGDKKMKVVRDKSDEQGEGSSSNSSPSSD